jgi:hypothetical protein
VTGSCEHNWVPKDWRVSWLAKRLLIRNADASPVGQLIIIRTLTFSRWRTRLQLTQKFLMYFLLLRLNSFNETHLHRWVLLMNPKTSSIISSCIPLLAYFPYFEKIKVSLCYLHAHGVSPPPPINFWMPEPNFMKLGIMAPEPFSMAYFINPSHQAVCTHVYPLSLLRNVSIKIPLSLLGKCNEYTRNRRIVATVVFYAVRVVWGKVGD